ncbi:MAG: hydrolase 76 protein [Claussenomyces sp. TS43310]|nr:MAG: hydrolase 76 protein [Claussenomyces sp. TS43310]
MRLSSAVSSVAAAAYLFASQSVNAITLDVTDDASIKAAASQIAFTMMGFYTGNNTGDVPGNLPPPYYWWECGGMMGAMVDYWYYTNDTTYNSEVSQALLWQAGPDATFMPANQSKDEGNDDQSYWAFSAMEAAETKFPDPPSTSPQWLAMAQGVFNQQANRWDMTSCGGGLKWQIFFTNNGYDYKNSPSNGAFFAMGARLAVYTNNATYADWAEKTWNWMSDVGLLTANYDVYDGTNDLKNCTDWDRDLWTYNFGVMLLGAAHMYVYTNESSIWLDRVNGILNTTISGVFRNGIMKEITCENEQGQKNYCNTDQLSFKSYLARWMAATARMVPSTYDTIMPILTTSAKAAAAVCNGGTSGVECGSRWDTGGVNDGTLGVGQQMNALQVISALLVQKAPTLVTNTTGGTSKGNDNAGSTGTGSTSKLVTPTVATTSGKAGAGFLTALILCGVLGGSFFMIKE